MDVTKDIVAWIIGIGAASVLSLITGIFAIFRSGKMLPKEIEGADLNNKKTETEILQKMQDMLKNAINDTAEWQNKFDKLDDEFRQTRCELENIKEKSLEQNDRIIALEALSKSQKDEIIALTTEVNNYSLWTNALVKQLEIAELKPVKMEDVEGVDLSAIRKNKIKK